MNTNSENKLIKSNPSSVGNLLGDDSQPIKIEQIIDVLTTSNDAQYDFSKMTGKHSNDLDKSQSAAKKSISDKKVRDISSTKSNKLSANVKNLVKHPKRAKLNDSRRLNSVMA